jgi:hypothetical protein
MCSAYVMTDDTDDILPERVQSKRTEKGLNYIVKKQEYEERKMKLQTK